MVRVDTVLQAIRRGVEDSGRMPSETGYRIRRVDAEGSDTSLSLPSVVVTEVTTTRAEDRSTDLVGVVRDDTGAVIGRIFEMGFDMEAQIDVYSVQSSSYEVEDLTHRVRRALQQYDSQLRQDLLPDEGDGTVGAIREFTVRQSTPIDDLGKSHSLRGERLSAYVGFTDRLNEVDEYGPIEPIKEVRTPRDGDFAKLSDDYSIEYQAPDDTS